MWRARLLLCLAQPGIEEEVMVRRSVCVFTHCFPVQPAAFVVLHVLEFCPVYNYTQGALWLPALLLLRLPLADPKYV